RRAVKDVPVLAEYCLVAQVQPRGGRSGAARPVEPRVLLEEPRGRAGPWCRAGADERARVLGPGGLPPAASRRAFNAPRDAAQRSCRLLFQRHARHGSERLAAPPPGTSARARASLHRHATGTVALTPPAPPGNNQPPGTTSACPDPASQAETRRLQEAVTPNLQPAVNRTATLCRLPAG